MLRTATLQDGLSCRMSEHEMTIGSPLAVERSRLLSQLNAALRVGHVLVAAPAGYGKSMLLRSLVAGHPRSSYVPLTSADADFVVLQERLAPLLTSDATIVLDDAHLIGESPEAQAWLLKQLHHQRPAWVIGSRHRVFSPEHLAGILVSQFGASDLAFSLSETRVVLGRARGAPDKQIDPWHRRTGGWPLAVGLLARQTLQTVDVDLLDQALLAYLTKTLLTGLPDDLGRYLFITGQAVRFNDALATDLLAAGGLGMSAPHLRIEADRRNLFLEPAQLPGWFRYHELIQDFLRHNCPFDPAPFARFIVAWFEALGDIDAAIEQALASRLESEAVRLILQVPPEQIRRSGRYLTYRRWVLSLAPQTREAHPALLAYLGQFLHSLQGFRDEAWTHVQHAHAAARLADLDTARTIALRMGFMHYREGHYQQALSIAQDLLDDPLCVDQQRLYSLRLASVALSETARFAEARRAYSNAIDLAAVLGDQDELHFNRNNLALTVLIPLGDLEAADNYLRAEIEHFTGSPGQRLRSLTAWCDLCTARGDWPELASTLAEWRQLQDQMEVAETGDTLWLSFYEAVLAAGERRYDDAWRHATRMRELTSERPLATLSLTWLECRLLRLQSRLKEAAGLASAFLAEPGQPLFWRSSLALDRDIALGLSREEAASQFELHPETRRLVQWRARAELVRLAALLAVVCWRRGDVRWRRHALGALALLRRRSLFAILTHRDPDLGAAFWSALLAENLAAAQAVTALRAIADPEPLFPLLADRRSAVRMRAAETLALMGRERAMPALTKALNVEHDPAVSAALERALAHLESQPPPVLRVQLMGEFALWRDEQPVSNTAWFRPIVRRLFQYFALHRGAPLPKDRILEDLWPDSPPEHGWAAFRTAYSRMRHTIDPVMRAKGPARYFAVSSETYRFDPAGLVRVDVEDFQNAVRSALAASERDDVAPPSDELLEALERWAPLTPELAYEEWSLEARERLDTFYVEGCLLVAESFFTQGRPVETIRWAQRVVDVSPWQEHAYQLLIRAYARLGQRAHALQTFKQAKAALERELGIDPSPLTTWLAERLRRGEEI